MPLVARLGCGDKSGFPGTGRAQIVRSFILSPFSSRRKPEDHEAPRRFAAPHHRELTERIIGLATSAHRSGLLESFYAAAFCTNWRLWHELPPLARTGALCDELELAGIPMRRQAGIPAIYQGKPLPLGIREIGRAHV